MLVLPITIEKISSRKDRTWVITIGTNELTPDTRSQVTALVNEFCYMALKVEEFSQKEKDILKGLKSDFKPKGKSETQRLRHSLYRFWESDNGGFTDSENHYIHWMGKIINSVQTKIL